MTRTLFLDLETRSELPLTAVGTYRYAEECEITLFGYKFAGEQEAYVWQPFYEPIPDDLKQALDDPEVILLAHNVQFDRVILKGRGYDLPIRRWRCSQACAQSLGLPGKLEKLGQILSLPEDEQKMKESRRLVLKFCKPVPVRSRKKFGQWFDRNNSPDEWREFVEYCRQDVVSLEALWNRLPKWNYKGFELESWFLDQDINDTGVAVDTTFVKAAVAEVSNNTQLLSARMSDATVGLVSSVNKRDALLTYIASMYDVFLPDLKGSTIEGFLEAADLPTELLDLLVLRLKGTKTSTAKYKRIQHATNTDGYLRGLLRWCGAQRTGRWSGQIVQPQNLPRPEAPSYISPKKLYGEILTAIDATKDGSLTVLYGDDSLLMLANSLRSVIVAPEYSKLVVSDLSNIEGRMLAWLAGEEWKIKAFADYDRGEGPDLYALAYAKSFHVSPDVVMDNKTNGDGSFRQIGKTQELSMGYEGGVGAFVTFATAFGIDLDDLAGKVIPTLDAQVLNEAAWMYDWAVKKHRTYDLPANTFIACEALKRLWRYAHPATVTFWKDLRDGFINALQNPGETYFAGRVKLKYHNPWLALQLPSGRLLTYLHPRYDPDTKELSYMGVNQFTKQWRRIKTFGGKLAENAVQAASRDILAYNLFTVRDAGYLPVLTVHDEVLTYTPDSDAYDENGLSKLLATNPSWSRGLPLAAAGFSGYRYKKD